MTGAEVQDNPEESRFEFRENGELAQLIYRRRPDRLVLIHTEVPDALEGRGIGGKLVQAAVDSAAADGLTLVPLCPFANTWLQRHPDAASKASIDWATG